ncbi:EF-P 5-aminopentanol modification-associated protein YfmF [Lentilactobacillus farraginis]|uniref:M16B subfamily protease n=1 Tax=Lentilactobacillus farraginis DSM 18382 = JCM 14108 TaxID=1423743 RepID=X0P912_9LACO|nr:insulinase family protein [Lentilactobacillus farraginis]KRM10068.1 M16B subfamily protease [Lentilactobacillus farraginis DSM 18382 = JCM 14108]GAF35224.1 zinc protease [Lentilactobacillus farraginis DSM 18382 = JCM 14108]
MNIQIAKGVNLNVIQTEQFKNNTIMFNFSVPSRHENFSKLALLADLLENAADAYPGEMLVSRKLSEMYGAGYGVTVLRYGEQHTLRIRLTFPNNRYLPNQADLLEQGLAFLREMIERPFIRGNQFEPRYFKIHQKNLARYIQGIPDNREFFSVLQLQKLYYANNLDEGTYLLGDVAGMQQLHGDDLYHFYQNFLRQARITIVAAGRINAEQVVSQLNRFSIFNDRDYSALRLFIEPQLPNNPREGKDTFPGSQSLLNLAYRLPVYYGSSEYFAANVFNQLFGASTRSLLFTNIREKSSLAYDIHSNYNSLAGMLSIQAGINAQNLVQVMHMINTQIEAAKSGAFSDELLAGVKKSMINQHRAQSDYLNTLAERQYVRQTSHVNYQPAQWEASVNAVTKMKIAEIADQLHYEARYVLQSQEENNENN